MSNTSTKHDEFDEDAFRLKLITAQYELRESVQVSRPRGMLILVNGVETAGKGKAVANLREWVDPRLLKVSYLETQLPSDNTPIWQRHAYPLPRHGEITVMFGNWYADLIHAYTEKKIHNKQLQQHLRHIAEFEQDLCANDTRVVKCWFEISDKTLAKRIKDGKPDPKDLYKIDWTSKKQVKRFREIQEQLLQKEAFQKQALQKPVLNQAILESTTNNCLDWHIIDGEDLDMACQRFCEVTLEQLQAPVYERSKPKRPFPKSAVPQLLLEPDDNRLERKAYKEALKAKQKQLAELIRDYRAKADSNIVMVFEGMDAAGKGGSIKRIVSDLDPREYQIHNIAAPEPVELQHPYLWRFWHRLPSDGGLGIFDRSWYGRVLVERVEAFAKQAAWQEAYDEINRFEQQLVDKNVIILKFWLAIGMDTQLERFKERENTPHKRFKITPDDWRNRDRWEDYVQAAADMLERTSTEQAPWHIVATNDKYSARLQVLQHCIDRLSVG